MIIYFNKKGISWRMYWIRTVVMWINVEGYCRKVKAMNFTSLFHYLRRLNKTKQRHLSSIFLSIVKSTSRQPNAPVYQNFTMTWRNCLSDPNSVTGNEWVDATRNDYQRFSEHTAQRGSGKWRSIEKPRQAYFYLIDRPCKLEQYYITIQTQFSIPIYFVAYIFIKQRHSLFKRSGGKVINLCGRRRRLHPGGVSILIYLLKASLWIVECLL